MRGIVAMTANVIVPSNPADKETILNAIKEADACLFRIESEKDQIKAIIEKLDEDFPDLGKKYINKMIRTYHKQNFEVVAAESDDFIELYTAIVNK